MLHITNGDSVTSTFRQVKLPGSYIAWRDVLHDGPVPQTETLEELSDVRARALSDFGAGEYEQVRAGFASRDRALRDFRKHQDVVLWFEHDLFDQLQLLQLLDWFSQQDLDGINFDMVQIASSPGIVPFHGLGQLSGTQLAKLFPMRKRVTHAQTALASRAWQAFCSNDPTALLEFGKTTHPELPFLCEAIVRFLEEYP